MVFCLKGEAGRFSIELNGKAVFVFLSNWSFRRSVVWNSHDFFLELLVQNGQSGFLLGKSFLDLLSFLDIELSCFVVKLLLHFLSCFISLASEVFNFQKKSCPFFLILDDFIKVYIHVSILDVLCYFVISGLKFLYVYHLCFPPYYLVFRVISSLFLTVASTASWTMEAKPPSVRALMPSMVVPRGEHTIVSNSIAPLPVAF